MVFAGLVVLLTFELWYSVILSAGCHDRCHGNGVDFHDNDDDFDVVGAALPTIIITFASW